MASVLSKGRVIGLQSERQAKANPEGPSKPGDFKCKGPLQEGCKESDLVITTHTPLASGWRRGGEGRLGTGRVVGKWWEGSR